MSNTAKVIEFPDIENALKVVEDATAKITAGRSNPLGSDEINRLYGWKVINKSAYIQLALAHDFGVMTDPQLDPDQCKRFADKWSRTEGEITASDMRKAVDKLKTALFKNDPDEDTYPQLNLFS